MVSGGNAMTPYISTLVCAGVLLTAEPASTERPAYLIGYTTHRTDRPGGQFANFSTGRAFVVQGDGTLTRQLAPELTRKPNQ
jgi:hypothetical protein